MILSNVAIHQALDEGSLIIRPEPPRAPTTERPSCAYDTTAVNLRLASTLLLSESGPFAFDLRTSGMAAFLERCYSEHKLHPEAGYALPPGRFVLGNTVERITLPVRPHRRVLAGRVEGRSSFARAGLLVHFTAPTIHAGFDGHITLEIINLGAANVLLFPGMEICQLILEMVLRTPTEVPSQFHGQDRPAGTRGTR